MYGYSTYTIVFWAVEAVITGLMAALLILGIWRKWRFTALVYPVGQLFIRVGVLLFQPSDYGYEISLDKAALLICLCIVSGLMLKADEWGYVAALCSLWMLVITLPEGLSAIGTYFLYGYELLWLAFQVIFSAITYLALAATAVLYARHWYPVRSPEQAK